MKTKIENILKSVLPSKTVISVSEHKNIFASNDDDKYLKIWFATSDINIHNVSGQKPEIVSLYLDLKTLELHPQNFGGNGGQLLYLKPNLNDPKEKYLAMAGLKIPFRKPQPNEKAVLNAVEKFAKNWLNAIKENKDRIFHSDLVNYDEFLNS